jgi:hypothetical protein
LLLKWLRLRSRFRVRLRLRQLENICCYFLNSSQQVKTAIKLPL